MDNAGNGIGGGIIAVFAALVGLAMVAVLVSQKAQTGSILTALGTSGSSLLNAATAPVSASGNTVTGTTSGG
jgi:hypothetical protein